ncbi:MAG: hypothetical protein Q9164_003443 [Protoblastenia rupestris]
MKFKTNQCIVTHRSFSFSCCDIEPAILARNVVLYTLIVDSVDSNDANQSLQLTLWSLFYHFFIPKQDLSVLHRHITKLLEASSSYKSWTSSSYGRYVRFVDQSTLPHLRKYWVQYAAAEKEIQVEARNSQARSAIAKRSKEVGNSSILNGARAAGPLLLDALVTMPDTYRKFWKSGVAGGNSEDINRLGSRAEHKVNPMFAVSSAALQDFAVHYATEPLANFHVAEAFHDKSPGRSNIVKAEQVVAVAKAQFADWCNAFKRFVREGKVILRFFFGDALALGHALQLQSFGTKTSQKGPDSYRKAWSAEPLLMDGDCPEHHFDVIDTSNLGDHVGLINMLCATAPLLHPAAVLYTESLLMATEDTAASLATLLGSDVTTFSLLIGLTPSGLQNSVTFDAVGNEAAMYAVTPGDRNQRQYRMRLTWKPIQSQDLRAELRNQPQIRFEPKALAAYLFSIYKKMFVHEDSTQMMERAMRMNKGQYSIDQARYTRAGMVALLRLAKSRIDVDWDNLICLFLDKVESDRTLIVGSNSLQELYMYLHLFSVWTSDVMTKDPRQLNQATSLGLRSTNADRGLLASDKLPSIIHLVLVVPRQKLEVFTKKNLDEVGTPALHVSVSQMYGSSQFENCFFSFQCFFGNVEHDSRTSEISEIKEDEKGWLGTGDLVVITAVPTFGLLTGPRDGLRVAFKINTSPETIMRYSSLGVLLNVFETGLKDDKRCFVCYGAPNLTSIDCQDSQTNWMQAATSGNRRPSQTLVKLDCSNQATHLQNHIDFTIDSAEGKALASGSVVNIEHVSPCTIAVCLGTTTRHTITYPSPIQGSKAKTRIARKSSWIEVEVPIASHKSDPFDSWTQMVLHPQGTPICKDVPPIDLSIQPLIPITKATDTAWIRAFLGPMLSDTESAINAATANSPTSGCPKVDFKQSLNTLLASFANMNDSFNQSHPGRRCQTFQLTNNNSCHTILFATALHHDLDLNSITLEAYVLPLTMPKVMQLGPSLAKLQESTTPCNIRVTPAENILWKRLLPALAERCRSYPHKSDCEYRQPGATIPLSVLEADNPLCSCGEGQLSASEFVEKGRGPKEWRPFAKYVTRVAISPIFPVPFVENSMSDIKDLAQRTRASDVEGRGIGASSSLPMRQGGDAAAATSAATATASEKCDHCGKVSGALKTCGGVEDA